MTKPITARTLAALALAVLLAAGAVRAEVIEQILVKVNGEVFTKTDLEARQVVALRQRGQQIDAKANDAELRRILNEVTPQIMVDSLDEMLIVQRGKELGYKLTDEQFNTSIEQLKKENKIESDEQLQAALTQENMTMADLRRQLERQMVISRVQQNEVLGKIGINEEEARAYYDAHLSEFTTTPSVTLREILVAVPTDGRGLNVGVDEERKERAEQIRTRVLAGDSFEKLATEMSEAPSRAGGGLIGPINLDDVSPDLRKLVEPLKAGETTPVVRTSRGYQLFKLELATPAVTMPFEQARERISDRVFTTKRKAEFDKYLDKLRSQAIIEWKNEDIRKAFEIGLTAAKNAVPPVK